MNNKSVCCIQVLELTKETNIMNIKNISECVETKDIANFKTIKKVSTLFSRLTKTKRYNNNKQTIKYLNLKLRSQKLKKN